MGTSVLETSVLRNPLKAKTSIADVATPRLINGPLLVGGKLDVGVEVVCIDHPLGSESIAPDAHCVREDCSEDDEIRSAHKASTTGNYKRPMDSGNEPPLL